MALVFVHGTMSAGKSTVALQFAHSLRTAGLDVRLWSAGGRDPSQVASRIGVAAPALDISGFGAGDVTCALRRVAVEGGRHVCVDEAQFCAADVVDAFAAACDDFDLEIACFGLRTDFRGELFAGAARLFAVADRVEPLPVPARCWCGAVATHNARLGAEGDMVVDGPQVLVGAAEGSYAPVCRRHFTHRIAHRPEP